VVGLLLLGSSRFERVSSDVVLLDVELGNECVLLNS